MKQCTRCGEWKQESEFNKDRSHSDGLRSHCKYCCSKGKRKKYRQNPKKEVRRVQKYNRKHREKIRIRDKERLDKLREKGKDFFGDQCSICDKKLIWGKAGQTIIHHIDGSWEHKGYALQHRSTWNKCILLCSRCHWVIHRLSEVSPKEIKMILRYAKGLRECLQEQK